MKCVLLCCLSLLFLSAVAVEEETKLDKEIDGLLGALLDKKSETSDVYEPAEAANDDEELDDDETKFDREISGLLGSLLNRKSETGEPAEPTNDEDEDGLDDQELDEKMLRDIMTGNDKQLKIDLQARMKFSPGYKALRNNILRHGVANILYDATRNVGDEINDYLHNQLSGHSADFCDLKRDKVKWVRQVKELFSDVNKKIEDECPTR